MNVFDIWTDDAIRDGIVSGHIPEMEGLRELERRHPTPGYAFHRGIPVPTPRDVFA